jgi:mono/diheme cytochrome c family protein
MKQTIERVARMAVAACVLTFGATALGAEDRLIAEGRASFTRYCASCHGADGAGNGPLAPELRTPPTDLTRIRERNRGRWPYTELRDAIDGQREIALHGPREMPVWGKRLGEPAAGAGASLRASGEITALLEYLKSIQRPPHEGDEPAD